MSKIQLLIADDEQLECDALELMISESGYDIACLKVKNGKEAVSLAEKIRPQILLLDIQMPGMTGLEAAENIRRFLPNAIIVFLTAWGRFDFAQKAIRVKALDYIVKPVDRDAIQHLLSVCIKQINAEGSTVKPAEETAIYNNNKLLQAVSSLQDAVLSGDYNLSLRIEQDLLKLLYNLYGHTEKAGHELYELFLIFSYNVCKVIPFLYQEKPTTENAAQMESILAQFISTACEAVRTDRKDKYERIFSLIVRYIEMHFSEELSVETVASQFNIHPVYFTRLFRQYCRCTFVEYLTNVRMKHAAKMLIENISVKDTAAACGFTDTNYFSRIFRRYYDINPAEYKSHSPK